MLPTTEYNSEISNLKYATLLNFDIKPYKRFIFVSKFTKILGIITELGYQAAITFPVCLSRVKSINF